ncbi:hypothetical protein F5884DRAFT_188507 [Xylogone sp. PMI_703]|nr:hypothetical protein F5884DRAFT_188507 [Xylogone sp. PMI_703]
MLFELLVSCPHFKPSRSATNIRREEYGDKKLPQCNYRRTRLKEEKIHTYRYYRDHLVLIGFPSATLTRDAQTTGVPEKGGVAWYRIKLPSFSPTSTVLITLADIRVLTYTAITVQTSEVLCVDPNSQFGQLHLVTDVCLRAHIPRKREYDRRGPWYNDILYASSHAICGMYMPSDSDCIWMRPPFPLISVTAACVCRTKGLRIRYLYSVRKIS